MTLAETGMAAETATIVTRAANEGVPVGAIARIVQQPFAAVSEALLAAYQSAQIGLMPPPDWPPGAPWHERTPTIRRSAHADEIVFQCKKTFGLTKLEAGFLVVLLRYDCADRDKLHGVIEEQRAARPQRPGNQECTDPKMVDVIICKLRKKLKKVAGVETGITLGTSWGHGYYFDPDMKQRVLTLITNGPTVAESIS